MKLSIQFETFAADFGQCQEDRIKKENTADEYTRLTLMMLTVEFLSSALTHCSISILLL